MLTYNMELCGFDVVSFGGFKGTSTKITVKYCNVACDDTAKKAYSSFISNERFPLYGQCQLIIASINITNDQL